MENSWENFRTWRSLGYFFQSKKWGSDKVQYDIIAFPTLHSLKKWTHMVPCAEIHPGKNPYDFYLCFLTHSLTFLQELWIPIHSYKIIHCHIRFQYTCTAEVLDSNVSHQPSRLGDWQELVCIRNQGVLWKEFISSEERSKQVGYQDNALLSGKCQFLAKE